MIAPPRPRILVVDDEAEIRDVLRETLAREGYEIVEAANAAAALAAVRDHRPHAVLLDLMMPGSISGQDIVAAISRDVPVIVITALTDVEIARRTLQEGAFDLVMKPFDLRRVADIVEAALAHGATDS